MKPSAAAGARVEPASAQERAAAQPALGKAEAETKPAVATEPAAGSAGTTATPAPTNAATPTEPAAPLEAQKPHVAEPPPVPTPVTPPSPTATEAAARSEFDVAQREYDLGRFDRAIDHYSRAYEAMPLPPFLFNIGQCHRQLGDFQRAAFFYRRYLDLSVEPQNAGLAKDLLKEMEKRAQETDQARITAENAQKALAPLPDPTPAQPPLYKRWYVWAAAGGVVAATATAFAIHAAQPPSPTLGTIDGR